MYCLLNKIDQNFLLELRGHKRARNPSEINYSWRCCHVWLVLLYCVDTTVDLIDDKVTSKNILFNVLHVLMSHISR